MVQANLLHVQVPPVLLVYQTRNEKTTKIKSMKIRGVIHSEAEKSNPMIILASN